MRELAASRAFVEACSALRAAAEEAAERLAPAPLVEALVAKGYAEREIDDIRGIIDVFSHGNMPYLMIATAARLLLDGRELGGETEISAYPDRHGPSMERRLTLIEPHHADAGTAAVYDDIKATLGLPFVNTDYRALARWPSYFAMAWDGLSGTIGTRGYDAAVLSVHEFAVGRMAELPNPRGLDPDTLRSAAAKDASLAEVTDVVRLFQWLLPGLIVNVAYFRAQLR